MENVEIKKTFFRGLNSKDALFTILIVGFFIICFLFIFLIANDQLEWRRIIINERPFLAFSQIPILLVLIAACFYRYYLSKNTATLYISFVWVAHLIYKIFSIIAGIVMVEMVAPKTLDQYQAFVVGIVAMVADVPLILCSVPEKNRKLWLPFIPIVTIIGMFFLYSLYRESESIKSISYIISPSQSFLILLLLIYSTIFKNNFDISKNQSIFLGLTFVGLAISQIFFIYEGFIYPDRFEPLTYIILSRITIGILFAMLVTFLVIIIDELSGEKKKDVEQKLAETQRLLAREKELNDEILQQKKEFEDLYLVASSVEHELRNPLSVINSTFITLRAKYQSDERLLGYLDDLEAERLSMVAAVDLVNILKSDNEDASFRMKKIYLKDLFNKIKKKVEIEFKGKLADIYIKIEEEKQRLFVNGTPFLLEKVFINFIKNSIESIHLKDNRKGVIHIELDIDANDKNKVVIRIKDNGIGFVDKNGEKLSDEEIKQCISAKYTTKTPDISKPNKGIGLFVSDRVVRIHDGEMQLKNADNEGAEVVITLDRVVD